MEKHIHSIIKLRRDNDYNYARVGNTFVPTKGEICLVDTAKDGLRAVCGDGYTVFNGLRYIDEFIVKGYYYSNEFYADFTHTIKIDGATHKLYIDLHQGRLYYFNEDAYFPLGGNVPNATSTVAGIVKLYNETGENEDGTMTQKAITNELKEKVEMDVDIGEELLILSNDLP